VAPGRAGGRTTGDDGRGGGAVAVISVFRIGGIGLGEEALTAASKRGVGGTASAQERGLGGGAELPWKLDPEPVNHAGGS
jgi:hypothetical protein